MKDGKWTSCYIQKQAGIELSAAVHMTGVQLQAEARGVGQ